MATECPSICRLSLYRPLNAPSAMNVPKDEYIYDREGRSLRNRSSHEAIGWRLGRICGRCVGRGLRRDQLLLGHWRHVLGWVAATSLTLYGGILIVPEALVTMGVIRPTQPVDWKALLWHLYVWDMSFLVWGILFGVATWHYSRTRS